MKIGDSKTYQYYAYRYLLVEESRQMFLGDRPKEWLMPDLFRRLESDKKLIGLRRKRRHLLIYVATPRAGLYISKLAKERLFTKLDEGAEDVEPVLDHDYGFVTVIVDVQRQMILIQRKPSAFEPESAKRALEAVLRDVGDFGRHNLVMSEITPENQFWDYIASADGVYRLRLTLHGPNFFEDLWKGEDIARRVHEQYGSTETTIDLRSDRGGLRVVREVFGDIVKVISSGGGKYLIGVRQRGADLVKTFTSSMNTVCVWVSGEGDHTNLNQVEQGIAEVDKAHDGKPGYGDPNRHG